MLHAAVNNVGQTTSIGDASSSPISVKSGKRKPLQILTGIFSRKNNREMSDSSEERDNFFLSDDGDGDMMWDSTETTDGILEPREALHSPYHARTIDLDMQNLRLSRQDNPFLQVLASRECLNESDEGSEYEEKNLMSKENVRGHSRGDPLSLEEVHARLVRSPPPVMWTNHSRNSEPSFSHLNSSHHSLGENFVFQFPPSSTGEPNHSLVNMEPSPTLSCRSQGHGRFLSLRKVDNTLDILAAKFNLSPQPRRRPPSLKACPFPTSS